MTDDPYRLGEVVGYEVREATNLDLAREAVETAMTPLASDRLMRELVRLRALTASRSATDNDVALTLSAYVEALSGHPADALVACMRSWPHRHKFWPTLCEIEDGVLELTVERRMIEAAVRRGIIRKSDYEASDDRKPPTEKQIGIITFRT